VLRHLLQPVVMAVRLSGTYENTVCGFSIFMAACPLQRWLPDREISDLHPSAILTRDVRSLLTGVEHCSLDENTATIEGVASVARDYFSFTDSETELHQLILIRLSCVLAGTVRTERVGKYGSQQL